MPPVLRPKVLIHLVGREPVPIMLASRQFRPEKEILIYHSQSRDVAQRLQQHSHPHQPEILGVEVPRNDPAALNQALNAFLENPDSSTQGLRRSLGARLLQMWLRDRLQEVWVHLTGTTKLMSITAFHRAQQSLAPVLYLDTPGQRFLLWREGAWKEVPLKEHVNLSDHLELFGWEIVRKRQRVSLHLASYAERITRLPRKALSALTDGNPFRVPALEQLYDEMQEKHPGYPVEEFLRGKWLEIYVYHQLHALLQEPYFQVVLRNERIQNQKELDLLGMHRNHLVLVSAKTGRHFPPTIHLLELAALRQILGGRYARAALVVATALSPTSHFFRHAEFLGIRVFDFPDLPHLQQRFGDWLNSP